METWALTFLGVHRTLRPSTKRLIAGYVSVLLVAGGIIGELGVGIQVAFIDGQLQGLDIQLRSKNAILRSDSDQLLALVTQEAGSASNSANDAREAARQLKIDLGNATSQLEEAQKQLGEEQLKTAEAQLKAAEVQLALRRATEAAAASRRIVMGNRNGDEATRRARFQELEKYWDTSTVVLFVADDEAQVLAGDIAGLLVNSGWRSVSLESLASTSIPPAFIEEGVQIRTVYPSKPTDFTVPPPGTPAPSVVKALLDALSLDLNWPNGAIGGVGWEPDGVIHDKHPVGLIRYGFRIPENGVVITVGRKPTERYFWAIPDLKPATIQKK
jgi:hypothetical protein